MAHRLLCAGMLAVTLCACRESNIDDSTLIAGSGTVSVLQSRFFSSGDSRVALGAGNATYVVAKLELLNDRSLPLFPVISHFFLTDRSGIRYFAVDTGASALAGISNDVSPIAPGAKRAFVVGFRTDPTTMGTIRYDY